MVISMNKKVWSLEEDEYIKQMCGKTSFSHIASKLKCSVLTVQNRAEELGLEVERRCVRRWSQELLEN